MSTDVHQLAGMLHHLHGSLGEEFARSIGLPTGALNILIAVVAALTVSVSMRVVGALLVSAVMIVPVAIAQLVSHSFSRTMHLAMAIGVIACVSGLTITYVVAASPGAMIVVLLVAAYAVTAVGSGVRLMGRQIGRASCRERV